MGKSRKQSEPIRLGGHYMRMNGELIAIEPKDTNLPSRCKLAVAEMMTGLPHVIVDKREQSEVV